MSVILLYLRIILSYNNILWVQQYEKNNIIANQMCTNPSDTCLYCSDTLESFNEKGKFVKDNGVGFFTTNIDLNDPTNLCKCEKPFASFYALLDGYNGVVTKPCDLFIRK